MAGCFTSVARSVKGTVRCAPGPAGALGVLLQAVKQTPMEGGGGGTKTQIPIKNHQSVIPTGPSKKTVKQIGLL